LAVLGVAGQVLGGALVLVGLGAAAGVRGPLRAVRSALWGYELWAAFVVAAIATGGSLFFSEIAHFFPCELFWYQRLCMYPLSITTLLSALWCAPRAAALKPPHVQSKGGPRRRQANPRVLAIGAAVVVLAAVGIGLALAFSGGSGGGIPKNLPTFGSLANGLPGASDVQTMYGGIPQ